VLALLKLRFGLSDDAYRILKSYISDDVGSESEEFKWIDVTDVNILYLIKVVMLKGDPGSNYGYKNIDNLETFQTHFTLLIDKISKGGLDKLSFEGGEGEKK
jgi:hypothetical protein